MSCTLPRVVFRVAALGEKAHLIPQPLDDRAADKHAALQRVLRLSADLNADGGQQAVLAVGRAVAPVFISRKQPVP